MTRGNFWAGLIVGAAAGAISGLLLAPKSGSAMREDIAGSAKEAGKKAGEAWGSVKDRSSQMAGGAKDHVVMAARKGGEMADTAWGRARNAVKAGREAANEKHQELEAKFEEEKSKARR